MIVTNHPFEFLRHTLGCETSETGTHNPEMRLVVNHKYETRVVPMPVPGFGMVGLGKVGGSTLVDVIRLCLAMGFGD